jgi:hypothetical protein
MQLGDWVEFETIVVKQPTATGSRPATTRLARKRRGQVVGARKVYEVTNGAPPALTHPQQVLLVAISLHRHYRVFPNDVQLTTPPQPRRRRAQPAQPATAQATTVDTTPASRNRSLVLPSSAVEKLIADQIELCVARRELISSCKVTTALREVYPDGHILHDDVLRVLSLLMTPLVAQQQYQVGMPLCGYLRHVWYMPKNDPTSVG